MKSGEKVSLPHILSPELSALSLSYLRFCLYCEYTNEYPMLLSCLYMASIFFLKHKHP
nr:MAG TPA: hypothetical protein [Caudoviricetes sp.]